MLSPFSSKFATFGNFATSSRDTMNTNVKRLRKELQELKKNPEEDMVLYPEEDTIMRWKAFIRGPKDTPFEDGVFELAILTTPLYPMEPPKMKFLTKIFHPNVHFKVLHQHEGAFESSAADMRC